MKNKECRLKLQRKERFHGNETSSNLGANPIKEISTTFLDYYLKCSSLILNEILNRQQIKTNLVF